MNFQTKQGSTVSVSDITDIDFYGYSEIIRTRNFTIFTVYTSIFGQFIGGFSFFLTTYEVKWSKTREASIKLNMIASIFDLLKIFSEVIVASKCGPLAKIEKQAMS